MRSVLPQDKSHTIILVQKTASKASRTFLDYETVSGAVDGVFNVPFTGALARPCPLKSVPATL